MGRGERIPTGVCLTDGKDKYGYEFQCWEETDKVMLKVYECRGEDREEEEERFRAPSMSGSWTPEEEGEWEKEKEEERYRPPSMSGSWTPEEEREWEKKK